MRQHDFWDDYAKSMERIAEGNTLIARDIGRFIADRWRAAVRAIAEELSELNGNDHSPSG